MSLIDSALAGQETQRYFVRTDACSAKDAGLKSVSNGREAVAYVTCSKRCLMGLQAKVKDGEGTSLLFSPWDEAIDIFWEFRVFVYQGRITAISQVLIKHKSPNTTHHSPSFFWVLKYSWFDDAGWRSRESKIADVIASIIRLYNRLKDVLSWQDCVMDAHINKDTYEAELIEFNPFGAHLSSGSALFHWIKDHDILYGNTEGIEIRFVGSPPTSSANT